MRKIAILIVLSMVLVSPVMAQSSGGPPAVIGQEENYLTYDGETRQTLDVYRGETYIIENGADEPIHLTANATMPAGTDIYTNGTNVTKPIQPGEQLRWEVPIDEQRDVIYYSSADRGEEDREGGVIRIFDAPSGDSGGLELPFEIETIVAFLLVPVALGVGWLFRDRGVGIQWVN